MNNQVTIQASDGKVFEGTIDKYVELRDKVQKYEYDLKSKKWREDAERKGAEAQLADINEKLKNIGTLVKAYKKRTGKQTCYVYDYETCDMTVREVSSGLNAHDFIKDISEHLTRSMRDSTCYM